MSKEPRTAVEFIAHLLKVGAWYSSAIELDLHGGDASDGELLEAEALEIVERAGLEVSKPHHYPEGDDASTVWKKAWALAPGAYIIHKGAAWEVVKYNPVVPYGGIEATLLDLTCRRHGLAETITIDCDALVATIERRRWARTKQA